MGKLEILVALAIALQVVVTTANPIPKDAASNLPKDANSIEFLILHNNDMHARFEQTSADSTKCSQEDANTNKCYGGFARVAYEVRKYRDEAKKGGLPVIYLNAGDTYTGTPWFTVFKDNITAAFMQKLEPDAISLGNHEFDENVDGLMPFLNAVTFPVLATNLDLSKVPQIASSRSFNNSTIISVNGMNVGVIGYLTPDTKYLTAPNNVEFRPEIESINTEAARLTAQGIKIIIALGHSGYQKDKEIAMNCPDVDIVIGGHTNTFLYNGKQPDSERIEGPYPTTVLQPSGKEVPVVQAYAYTKYLGKLHVQFNTDGDLLEFDGTPILLNASVPREDDVLQLLEVYRPNITALEQSVIGHTKVHLEGRSEICRAMECNLGNLVADSMVYSRVLEELGGQYWTDAAIALIGGGGIRNSIEKRSDGSITESDVLSVLPFSNDLYAAKVNGSVLRAAFEHSATMYEADSSGGFLQMAGARVTYDYNKIAGHRVIRLEVRCADCDVPSFSKVDDTKQYGVVMPEFFLEGGDGYVMFQTARESADRLKKIDKDALIDFLAQREIVYQGLEGRINIIQKSAAASLASSMIVLLAAFVTRQLFH